MPVARTLPVLRRVAVTVTAIALTAGLASCGSKPDDRANTEGDSVRPTSSRATDHGELPAATGKPDGDAPPAAAGTYLAPRPGDLKYGQNRMLNACNLLPPATADKQFGKAPTGRLVQEKFGGIDVPEAAIGPTGEVDVSTCYYSVLSGTVSLALHGYATVEAAQKAAKITDRKPKVTVISTRMVSATGVIGSYRYYLEVELSTISSAKVAKLRSVATSLATTMLGNADNPKVTAAPRDVTAISGFDPCRWFDAGTFTKLLKTNSALAPETQVPGTTPISRMYVEHPEHGQPQHCWRYGLFTDTDTAQSFLLANLNISPDVTQAKEQFATILRGAMVTPDASTKVPGLGDEAYSWEESQGMRQLGIRKGRYVVTLKYEPAKWTDDPAPPAQALVPTAKTLLAKLPR